MPDDLLTRLLTVERGGRRLSGQQVLGFCQFLLVAGSATTTLLIGNVVHRLLEHPEQLAMVDADRSLIPAAVEESLRFDAPVHGLFRTPTCPVDLHGETCPRTPRSWCCSPRPTATRRRGPIRIGSTSRGTSPR